MRRRMIAVKQADHDPEETTDLRHPNPHPAFPEPDGVEATTNPGPVGSRSVGARCAALDDGSVACWNELGDVATVAGAVDITSVSGPCGLDAAGTVSCWNAGRIAVPVADGTGVVAISASPIGHTCAVRADGGVLCRGENCGALGDGTEASGPGGPLAPVGLPASAAVSAGGHHGNDIMACGHCDCSRGRTCALAVEGTVWCWGKGSYGIVPGPGVTPLPAPFPGLPAVAAISTGARHDCALLRDRTVVCGGDNRHGQLGDGGPFPTPGVPIRVVAW